MYSNKDNVNILTALLAGHGVKHAVVCPGSRNSAIVHNLNECPDIRCYAVTDERSAGFYALGMAQATGTPVVVCVTSGTALLNVLPSVAEAYYQHVPLVVVSADRPPQWIDQLDGQTLRQPGALGSFVRRTVTLPEPRSAEEHWYCNRLVNEALLDCRYQGGGPVHINVPISEPLFDYTTAALPHERLIERTEAEMAPHVLDDVCRTFMQSQRPMLIAGQPMNPLMDEAVMLVQGDASYVPDFVLYTGGAIVSKRLKRFLRNGRETWVVNREGVVTDTFLNVSRVVQGDGRAVAERVRMMVAQEGHPFVRRWEMLLAEIGQQVGKYEPGFSQMAAVWCFVQQQGGDAAAIHFANSMAIRLANIFPPSGPVWCNRGVNGIEGSLSTAAGYSCVTEGAVFCIIGDLSFFYDANALWNRNLRGNLRILLMNNGKGGIFNMLPGLEQSPARDRFVAGRHKASAEGVCRQNGVVYRRAEDMESMREDIGWLIHTESERPLLLEVLTDAAEDERVLRDYYRSLAL